MQMSRVAAFLPPTVHRANNNPGSNQLPAHRIHCQWRNETPARGYHVPPPIRAGSERVHARAAGYNSTVEE